MQRHRNSQNNFGKEKSSWRTHIILSGFKTYTSLITQLVRNLPEIQETLVQFLGQEDPLEKGLATHSSILGLPLWLSW